MKLTETQIRKLPPVEKDTLVNDGGGLHLRCYASGRKTWLYRTRKGGAWKTQNLGEWPAVSLAAARAKAATLNTTTLPDSMSFGELLQDWFERRIEPRYKRTNNIEVYVNRGRDWLGNVKLTQLTTPALVAKLQEYAGVAPVAANRCLSNWKLALDYGVEIGVLHNNPLARTTSRVIGGEEKSRERTLSDEEIRWLWADGHDHGPLLRALLLSGCRISEMQAARIEHLDGDTLHIPETKNAKPHWVYVTPLLRRQFGDFDEYLIAQRSETAVQARLRNTAKQTWTPHDLRRTFGTRLAGLGIAPHVIEKCLNHTMQGVMAIYNRHDYATERIEAAKAWSAEIERITAPGAAGNEAGKDGAGTPTKP